VTSLSPKISFQKRHGLCKKEEIKPCSKHDEKKREKKGRPMSKRKRKRREMESYKRSPYTFPPYSVHTLAHLA
jgi:hypothetical protein